MIPLMKRYLVRRIHLDEAPVTITAPMPAQAARELLERVASWDSTPTVQVVPEDGKGASWHFRCRAEVRLDWQVEACGAPREEKTNG